MNNRVFDVLVVGAGPVGLAAACRAAEVGAGTAIVDDNPSPGGQTWRAGGGAPSGPGSPGVADGC